MRQKPHAAQNTAPVSRAPENGISNAARQRRRTRSGKLKRGVYRVAYLYVFLAAL